MISSSEKDTSPKLELVRPSDPKSELWNVVCQEDNVCILKSLVQLNSQCTKRRQRKFYVVISLYPALKHSCCWYYAVEWCAR